MERKKTDPLFLFDASGFIFRAFYALPPLSRPDGTPVGAVLGFLNMVLKILETHQPSQLAIVFDVARRTFRQDICSQYKANRADIPEELASQFDLVREACSIFNLPVLDMPGFEADDVIATYTRLASEQENSVTIVSADKDLMQLVHHTDDVEVLLYDPLRAKEVRAPQVHEKFGVGPEQVVDVMALMGDASDNVPGIPGIGVKTAAELINRFGHLDNLFNHLDQVSQPKRRALLAEHEDAARRSRELVRLRNDVPVTVPLEDLQRQPYDFQKIEKFLSDHHFHGLLERLKKSTFYHFGDRSRAQGGVATYRAITDAKALKVWVEEAQDKGIVAISMERAEGGILSGIGLSMTPGTGIYVQQSLLEGLQPLFHDGGVLKVGLDWKSLFPWLREQKIIWEAFDDVSLLSYVLDGPADSQDLEALTQHHLGVSLDHEEYPVAQRADMVWQIHALFKKRLIQENLVVVYERLERFLIPVLAGMEAAGIAVDTELLRSLGAQLEERMTALETQIQDEAGVAFNVGSPKQVGEVLFENLGLPGGKRSKAGAYGTGVDILESLVAAGHALPGKILDWRHLAKLKNTYTDALLKQVNLHTGRVHTRYMMTATSTGRLSSVDPNLQNIPIRTADGRQIRKAFVAPPGHRLLSLDYSQIELRLLAHMGQVEALQAAFQNSLDIHRQTASEIFHVPLDEVDGGLRRRAKAINFGIIYGMSAFGLAQQLGIPTSEADRYIQAYFHHYPGIQAYMEQAKGAARERGFVRTLMGRRCYIPGIRDRNPHVRSGAERQAINAPIQGSSADIMKLAMIQVDRMIREEKLPARLLLQIHDELLFEVPIDAVDGVAPLLQKKMSWAASLSVPLVVDIGVGDHWDAVR